MHFYVLLGKELSVQGPRARLQLLSAAVTVSTQLPNTQWLLGVPEVTAEPRGLSGLSHAAGTGNSRRDLMESIKIVLRRVCNLM